MNPTTQKITHLIRQTINQVDDKAEVILYGSRARDDERKDYDWDLIILTDYPIKLEKEREFRDPTFDLELEREEHFQLFFYSKEYWHTKHKITSLYESVTLEGIYI